MATISERETPADAVSEIQSRCLLMNGSLQCSHAHISLKCDYMIIWCLLLTSPLHHSYSVSIQLSYRSLFFEQT